MLLVLLQLVGITAMPYGFAASGLADDIPVPLEPIKRLLLPTKDLFLDEIFKDPEFIKKWATLAHYMGIGWCGGTKTPNIGEDFEVTKVTDLNAYSKYSKYFDTPPTLPIYVIEARYNANDPYADGYRASERLKMFITKPDVMFKADTLEFGPVLHTNLEPQAVISKIIRNYGSTTLNSQVNCIITDTTSTTVTHGANVSGKLGVKKSVSVKASPGNVGTDSTTEVSFELTAGYSFANAQLSSTSIAKGTTESIPVLPRSKASATIYALKSSASFPYVGDVQAVYNMTLVGFYRVNDNSEWGHSTSRPDAKVTFGKIADDGGALATEDLLEQYINRSIQGNQKTDWQWVMDKYGSDKIKGAIGSIAKQEYVSRITGRFNKVNASIFQTVVKDLGPLGSSDNGLGEQQDKATDPVHGSDPLTPPDTTSRVNLALNKPVTVSNALQNNRPENAVNGTINSIDDCWKAEDIAGSSGPWITVDLGARRKIDYVSIANAGTFGYGQNANNRNMVLLVSDDNQSFRSVTGVQGNYQDRVNFSITNSNIVGRYVKVQVTQPGVFADRNAACIYDLAVYGYNINPDTYTVKYSGNGNTGGNVPVDNSVHYQYTNVNVASNTGNLERSGFDFAGWNTKADGSGETYNGGSTFKMGSSDVTLYAKWVPTKDVAYMKTVTANHAISYHPASNAVNGTMANIDDKWCTNQNTGAQWLEVDLGAEYNINKWLVKHAGAFGEDSGYNTRDFKLQRKSGSQWIDVDVVNGNTNNITEREVNSFAARFVRLYITTPTNNGDGAARIFQFKVFGERASENKYHVYYNGNTNLGGSAPIDSNEYTANAIVSVLNNTNGLTKPGYSFEGWNTMPDGSGRRYNGGSSLVVGTADMTLYAQWTKDTSIQNLVINKPAVASSSVAGQGPSNAVNGTINDENDKWCTDGYPQWLYVDLGDTYEISRWVVKHAEAGGESSSYNTSDYTLERSNSDASNTSFGTVDRVTGNTAAYTDRQFAPVKARYVRLNITKPTNLAGDDAARIFEFEVYGVPCKTMNYNGGGSTGGSVPGDTTYARNAYSEGATVTVLGNTGGLQRTGYTFMGWNTEPDGTGSAYQPGETFVMGTSNVVLYAQWRSSDLTNVALNKPATQHSTLSGAEASRAVDGNTNGTFNDGSVTLTQSANMPWWQVDLGSDYDLSEIAIYNRTDSNQNRLQDYNISVLNKDMGEVWSSHQTSYPNPKTVVNANGTTGRYVKIQLTGTNYLSLAEVEVMGKLSTAQNYNVAYNGNGSAGGNVPTDNSAYANDAPVTVLGNTGNMTKAGYTFSGWNTAADGSGTLYRVGDTFNMGSGNVTLYAQWTAVATNSNVALNKTATQSSNYDNAGAERAVDGNTNGSYSIGSVTHTQNDALSWWMVDLGSNYHISDIEIWNRAECKERLNNFNVIVLDENQNQVWINSNTSMPDPCVTLNANGAVGRYVKVQLTNREFLSLAEVKVYGSK